MVEAKVWAKKSLSFDNSGCCYVILKRVIM